MAPRETLLLVGVPLALLGAGSLLVDAGRADGSRRFVGYLIALLLSLAAIGGVLAATLREGNRDAGLSRPGQGVRSTRSPISTSSSWRG